MELEFERDTIICYETAAQLTVCQEETLEAIVPDACPDILRIVDVCGQAILNSKQAREGMATLSGVVRVVILYQPEGGGGLRRMEASLPFSSQAEAAQLTEQGCVTASVRLRHAEARALNPRKVLLRVDLVADITAYQPMEYPICRGVLNPDASNLCQRQFQGEDYHISSVQEKPFTFTEDVRPQGGLGEGGVLLAYRAQPQCTESKLIGNKLIFKGVVELNLLIQEAGGGLLTSRESLSFSQIMEVNGAGEDGDAQILVEVSEARCAPDSQDGRTLELSLDLLAQAEIRTRRPVTMLQDLYSTVWQMEVEGQVCPLSRLGEQTVRVQGVRELIEIPEAAHSVVESRLVLGQLRQSREGEQIVLTTEGWVSVLYLDEDDQLQCVRQTLPVTCRLDAPAHMSCRCRCVCPGEMFATVTAGGIEVRFSVEFHCLTTSRNTVASVKHARLGEARASTEKRPSVVLRMAGPGEGIWDIAKAYGTTTEQICQANELSEDYLPRDKMLLIPSVR